MGYKRSGGYLCIKFSFFIFNVLFWLLGCAILGVGIWLHATKGSFATLTPDLNFVTVTALCIAAGTIVLVVGFFGCCGAIMENKCMLMTYFLFVALIFVMEVVVAILGFINRDVVEITIQQQLIQGIKRKYPPDSSRNEQGLKQGWDEWQRKFQCCGVYNFTDWYNIKAWEGEERVPDSCCKHDITNCGMQRDPSTWHKQGCLTKFKVWLEKNLLIVGVVAASIAVIQIIGMIASMVLFCYLRNEDLYGDYDDYDS